MPYTPPPELAALSLEQIAAFTEGDTLPPIDKWHPEHCGNSDMRIARDGRWFHQGGEIRRPAMVRAFSRILRREPDGGHVLVTPYEKLDIEVEDAPFIAVDMSFAGAGTNVTLAFRLNTDDLVIAGPDHPLTLRGSEDAPRVYLHVRGGLEARINRAVFFDLAEHALAQSGDGSPGVWSGGAFFSLQVPA